VIEDRGDIDIGYDPRNRPWYVNAQKEERAFFTEPYVFSSSKLPGITCAEKLIGGNGVFGADITLDRFANSLEQQKVSDNGTLFLFDQKGRIIAHPQKDTIKGESREALHFVTAEEMGDRLVQSIVADYLSHPGTTTNQTREIRIGGATYLVRATKLKATLKIDQVLASMAPILDFTGHIQRMQRRVFIFSGVVLLLILPLTLLLTRKLTESLSLLERESKKIRQRDFSESAPFDSVIKEVHSLIKAFVLMKSTIRELLEQQRKLFDNFTKLIAGAIDAKSHYTGGHCARVPKIAEMLAQATCASNKGDFADFTMDTKDQRWEFEVAAWLHDCGKVTTPEYVVDKATKLETIYNRIHEIRMRFEVLLRDAEIDACRKRLAGKLDDATIDAELERAKHQVADDFAFVAACNIGGEFLADDKIERLRQIGNQTWTRHLDDRLGISQDEAALKDQTLAPTLPVVEKVLADKPEHIIPRTATASFKEDLSGFNMEIPESQYNFGEIYNLSIRKGTLTNEERFKIDEHIIQTIIMLNKLEFPEYLKNVPEFAGAHHETMIGTGYPRGLKKEDMSIPARIMAIADIFEALTASDRPYKKAKSLNETLRIMSFMRDDRHIDSDLFDLFLQRGVYHEYATEYLAPEQIDDVDINQYLSSR
jgi:HD-GYP domain-containing protein (c-di-GMP phosphodiesterase class II)